MTAKTSGAADEPVCRHLLDPEQAEVAVEGCGVPAEWIWYLTMTGELPVYHLASGPRIDEVELARVLMAHQARRR